LVTAAARIKQDSISRSELMASQTTLKTGVSHENNELPSAAYQER